MDEIELYLVREYNYVSPLVQKIDSLIDNTVRDCLRSKFYNF